LTSSRLHKGLAIITIEEPAAPPDAQPTEAMHRAATPFTVPMHKHRTVNHHAVSSSVALFAT